MNQSIHLLLHNDETADHLAETNLSPHSRVGEDAIIAPEVGFGRPRSIARRR